MASAIPPKQDLTRCGICKEVITNPKALPCLHTFCLECLREWSQRDKDNVTCPVLSCKKTTPIPSDGVDGLPGNVFVESLIENSPTRSKKVPCVCCEEKDNVVVAKCLDCNGFLCQEGLDVHKKPFLKAHQVIKLDDIKSGKANLQKLGSKKQAMCSNHKGQPLWFFCETCKELICRDCTVVNHQKPEHKHVELKSVVSEHKKKLEELVEANEAIKSAVEKRIQETKETRKAIGVQMQQASLDIDQTVEKIKAQIDELCRVAKERLAKERADFESEAHKELASAEETLIDQKETLQTALNMANQVIQTGSDFDISSVFQQISTVLQSNSRIKPVVLSHRVSNPPTFHDTFEESKRTEIGRLRWKSSFSSYVLEGRFGESDAKKGLGKLCCVRGIATNVNGDIAIANKDGTIPVKVYSIQGKFRYSLDKRSSNATDVATSYNDQFFVTTYSGKMVTMYDSSGQYIHQFAAVSPKGVSSNAENTALCGIVVDSSNNQVYVGEIKTKYLSIHKLDGTHYKSVPLKITPRYLAVTQQGKIIVSPDAEYERMQILDSSGTDYQTIHAPEGVSKWHPVGVCCSSEDDIFVFNRCNPVGIYRFSSSGDYLGCVNNETKSNRIYGGLTFSQDGEKLLVAVGSGVVNIFHRQESEKS